MSYPKVTVSASYLPDNITILNDMEEKRMEPMSPKHRKRLERQKKKSRLG